MNDIIKKCKIVLQKHYKDRFKGLLLFGSSARNQRESSSDIDMLVLLSHPFNYFHELRAISELLYPIQLESEQLISVKPVLEKDYEQGTIQLYRNAKQDGVAV
ncbi:MAG: nucleotidyltransferase domain-containing protein [Candidatus Aminicenantaceae bacterium]